MSEDPALRREILLAFWKVHILHHAAESPVYGQWILEELRRHGYSVSPGTIYPLLKRMHNLGWLRALASSGGRQEYRLSARGRLVLRTLRGHIRELREEVGDAT
jgi:PadR family transcriptional regulator, regulatory protein PadR